MEGILLQIVPCKIRLIVFYLILTLVSIVAQCYQKLRLREVNQVTQSHISDKWKILDLCLGLVDYEVCSPTGISYCSAARLA